MSHRPALSRLLIVHEQPARLADRIRPAAPDLTIWPVADARALKAALAEGPDAAFVIRADGVPGPLYPVIRATPSLKWLHVGGSGYEQFGPLDDRGDAPPLTVTNSAGVLAPYLAETCLGALLALNGRFFEYRAQQARRDWSALSFQPLGGRTLLIVGLGEIGGRFGALARGLGMRVIGMNRAGASDREDQFDAMRPLSALRETLAEVDAVSLHLRATPETQGLFDQAAFDALPDGALFLNTSRGEIVDQRALEAALASGRLGGAYLDVFEAEPLPTDSPLWSAERAFITPHASDSVVDWDLLFADFFLDNLRRWRAGEPMRNHVAG